MILIHQNKETNELTAFGSIAAIVEHTELKKDRLYYHFARQKKTVYEDNKHYIKKSNVIRCKHK